MNKRETLEHIGAYCREWREAEGLTLEEVGAIIGVTRQAIFAFERGRSNSAIMLYHYLLMMNEKKVIDMEVS